MSSNFLEGSKMQIFKTKTEYKLSRYAGQHDGKNVEKRIGSVPLKTSGSAIPEDLKEDLTPRELRQLITFLDAETAQRIREDCEDLARKVDEITTAVDAGIVAAESLDRIKMAAKSFLEVVEPGLLTSAKSTRRAKPKPVPAAAVKAADTGA